MTIIMKPILDLSTKLSENFTLREFVRSQTAEKYHIDNTPPRPVIIRLENLCRHVLQPLRDKFGPIYINSGYRCEKLNEKVRGVGNSQHLYGEAADIRIVNTRQGLDYYDFIVDNLEFDQLLFEYRKDGVKWLHVSCKWDVSQNRHMAIPNYQVK